jgi:hypothetical protein
MKFYIRQIKPYIRPPQLQGFNDRPYPVDGYDWVSEDLEDELRKNIVVSDPWSKLIFEHRIVEVQNAVLYPLDGMIYYVETSEESDEAWIGNNPIQYIDEEGYHCGWGLATLCFKFEDLGEVYFFSREEAKVNLGCKEKQL